LSYQIVESAMNLKQMKEKVEKLLGLCRKYGVNPDEVQVMMQDRLPVYFGCDIKDNQEVYLTDTGPGEHEKNFEAWSEQYKPKCNHITASRGLYGGRMFETFGGELEFVRRQPVANVWTLVNWEREDFLIPGFHVANRLGYFVTETPFEGDEFSECIIVGRYFTEDEEELDFSPCPRHTQ
jgi:hypothetical protein